MDILESLCGGIFIKKIDIMEPNKINFGADRYYKAIKKSKIICLDFDNTICLDEWPYIGPIIPGAIEVIKKLQYEGHKLILYTQRSYMYPICCKDLYKYSIDKHGMNMGSVDILTPAIKVFTDNGIKLDWVNCNGLWEECTNDNSRKVYMDYLIDDHVIGTKKYKKKNSNGEICSFVNWWEIDRYCMIEGLYKVPVFDMTHQEFYNNFIK